MRRRLARILALLPVVLVFFPGLAWLVRALWNGLMPSIFGLHTVTYSQALGLMVLSWILFGGFRGPRFHRGQWGHGMLEQWSKMTPAERVEFMKAMRSRWAATTSGVTANPTARDGAE